MEAENCCRFTGKLKYFSCNTVGDGEYMLGRGQLILPDPEKSNIFQKINIVCWGDIAERMSTVPLGSWVTVLSSYTPNLYKDRLYDEFTVGAFVVL